MEGDFNNLKQRHQELNAAYEEQKNIATMKERELNSVSADLNIVIKQNKSFS